jgi:hypothetical protein
VRAYFALPRSPPLSASHREDRLVTALYPAQPATATVDSATLAEAVAAALKALAWGLRGSLAVILEARPDSEAAMRRATGVLCAPLRYHRTYAMQQLSKPTPRGRELRGEGVQVATRSPAKAWSATNSLGSRHPIHLHPSSKATTMESAK